MLTIDSVRKAYATRSGELEVLRDVSLSVARGSSVSIMGPSGCGKSTLLNIIATLDEPTSGTVTIDGCNPFELDEQALARFRNDRVGFVFQEHHLLPQCSVLENILIPTLAHAGSTGTIDRARELADRVGLTDRLDHRPAELSGGERQRVAIARALVNKPVLLVADEPTGNLDGKTADTVADLLIEVHHEVDAAMIVVTHSTTLAERFDTRFKLCEGHLTKR